MGLLDALFGGYDGGGLLGSPASWQYPTSAPDAGEEKKKQDAAFLAAINQDPNVGGFNPGPSTDTFPSNASPLAGILPGQYGGSSPFGLGGANLPAQPQGVPAAGVFPAIPPQQPQMPQPAQMQPQPAAPSPMPAPQNNPINTMNIGGYQMPQFGGAADYTPQAPQATPTDVSAQSRAPSNQPLPPALGGSSFGGNLGASLQSFANTPGGLINKLAGGTSALLTGQRNDPVGIQQQNLKAQYDAMRSTLMQNGASPQEAASKAMLAVMNPEAAKTIIGETLTNKEKWGEIGSDSFGNKQYGWINERDQTINGKPMGADSTANGSTTGFLAPGVKSIDSTLQGQDYLKQFSPEVQAATLDYVAGKAMPTGNPRKGFTQTVKMIAQKYGADTGQSVDDATYAARRTMRNQLSSSAPSSLGGQINIGNTAAGHLADLSQKALELGNVDTGIAPLTAAVNSVRGLGTEQAAKMEALKGAAQHYGQEITKFYAGSPGGTAERDRFIESVNGARSPKELAAILATEGELMRSRLDALGGQIKGVLGDEGLKQYPVLRPDGQAALSKVEENVSRLKGGQGAAPSGGLPSGWSVKVH